MAGVNAKLVIMLVATTLVMLIGEAAVDRKTVGVVPTCVIQCTTRCHYIQLPNCFSDCMRDCIPPVSNAIFSDCKINCEISTCTKYASDVSKLEGCVSSCSQNCKILINWKGARPPARKTAIRSLMCLLDQYMFRSSSPSPFS
ncbi:hypothetical protein POM88_024263 [Heracleum sosnowskyi]|uniref:Thionin-like protein 2 n=1 Tax=Heracleum sosnowskyi TaxID=360622 RepID=A0AAD8I2Y3_9APIA|nr:hypothetical protein POM88_024263 [Heracleum sosnowskyi]